MILRVHNLIYQNLNYSHPEHPFRYLAELARVIVFSAGWRSAEGVSGCFGRSLKVLSICPSYH